MNCPTSDADTLWFVYIIQTEQHSLYTGITTDLERRFREHLDTANGQPGARGAKFFRRSKPQNIVYSERCATRALASKREAEIKSLSKRDKQALLVSSFDPG